MLIVFRTLVIALIIAVSGAMAQTTPSSADDQITFHVRMRLVSDADVKGGALEVVVKDGLVTLTGRVSSDKVKKKAERLAKKVKGVKAVDNKLTVGPPVA